MLWVIILWVDFESDGIEDEFSLISKIGSCDLVKNRQPVLITFQCVGYDILEEEILKPDQ